MRLPRLCVAIIGSDPADMIANAISVVREESFMEFRLDYLRQPLEALPALRDFLHTYPHLLAIATCRRAANGGKFRGPVASQLEVLRKAQAVGCQMVDVELESAQTLKLAELAGLRSRGALILSSHDFEDSPELDPIFQTMQQLPADYYKLVTTATCLYDNVRMMKFLEDKSRTHSVVGVCMGEQGVISRVLGLRAGSAFTFAAVAAGGETAPGQITARVLREVYRVDQLDPATRIYGVAGDPVAQSLSPLMMNAALRRENVNAVYLPLHAKSVEDLVECVRAVPIQGISVTMPHKEPIVAFLDGTDPWTQKTGAANTVARGKDGRLFGFNTDVAGVLRPLEMRYPLAGSRALVIGAGGAARAAAFGLGERGADVFIMNRTPAKGQKLAKEAKAKYLGRGDLRKHRFDVIINATPVGMNGNASPLSEKEIKANYVFDMVYTSLETPFTRAGRAAGAQVIPGYEMFVQQGVQQFQIWTAKPAPAAEMQNVVLAAVTANARLAEHSNGERAQADQPKEAKPKPEKTKAEKVKPAKVQAAKAKAPKPAPSKAKPKSKAKK
jgi:3-dehydroquinate dehydratase/shikimate dehydrogenase